MKEISISTTTLVSGAGFGRRGGGIANAEGCKSDAVNGFGMGATVGGGIGAGMGGLFGGPFGAGAGGLLGGGVGGLFGGAGAIANSPNCRPSRSSGNGRGNDSQSSSDGSKCRSGGSSCSW